MHDTWVRAVSGQATYLDRSRTGLSLREIVTSPHRVRRIAKSASSLGGSVKKCRLTPNRAPLSGRIALRNEIPNCVSLSEGSSPKNLRRALRAQVRGILGRLWRDRRAGADLALSANTFAFCANVCRINC